MKTFIILFFLIGAASSAQAQYAYATTPKEKADLFKKSKAAFIGHAEIVWMRYLGENDRVITPEEVAASKPFSLDPLFYTTESPIRRIEFSVKLVPDRMLKGKMPPHANYQFTYSNSLIVILDMNPRKLHKGGLYTFYILEANNNKVSKIAYGSPDHMEQPGEPAGGANRRSPSVPKSDSNSAGSTP